MALVSCMARNRTDEHDKDPDAEWLWHFSDPPECGDQMGGVRDLGPAEAAVEPPGEGSPHSVGAAGTGGVEASGQTPAPDGGAGPEPASPPIPKVRPIQMGEFLRKVISKRILAAARGGIDAAVLGARQWGVGADGGAEGIIHADLAVERIFANGELPHALAKVQVDAENCFGRLEWADIREEVLKEVPELGPVVAWKHRRVSYVEQPGTPPQVKDRGAEQGDTFGPAETGVALAALGRKTRRAVHAKQVTGELPWATPDGAQATAHFREVEARVLERDRKQPIERAALNEAGSRETHPANAIQQGGGIVDVWFLDDGTAYMMPDLAAPYLGAYDRVTAAQGGKRNFSKTVVTLYATDEQVRENAARWDLEHLKTLCVVQAPTAPGKSLGVALGGVQARAADFRTKASIAQKMHDKVRRIGGSGAELALSQACLGWPR